MKKKIVVLLSFVLVICSLLCGCGKQYVEVNGEKYKINEIQKMNYLKYNEEIAGKTVTIVGKLYDIGSTAKAHDGNVYDNYIVIGVDRWQIYFDGYEDVLIDLENGDMLEVKGEIINNMSGKIYVRGTSLVVK